MPCTSYPFSRRSSAKYEPSCPVIPVMSAFFIPLEVGRGSSVHFAPCSVTFCNIDQHNTHVYTSSTTSNGIHTEVAKARYSRAARDQENNFACASPLPMSEARSAKL